MQVVSFATTGAEVTMRMLPVLIRGGGEHCVTPARTVAWENSWHFARTPSTVSQRNDVWETSSGEIPYWWCVTSPIWMALLIGWKFASTNHKHYLDLNSESRQYGISPPARGHREHCIATPAPVAAKETSMQVEPVRLVEYYYSL